LHTYDEPSRFRRHRMGKKIRGKPHVRDTLPVEEKTVEDGLRKPLSRQKRNEVSKLVERLLEGK